MENGQSEFGRGYATCLRQFLNHKHILEEILKIPFLGLSVGLSSWVSGANDHLIELIRPNISDGEWERAVAFRSTAFKARRGDKTLDEIQVRSLIKEAEDLLMQLELPTADLSQAMEADRLLGIEPDPGNHSCPYDSEVSFEITKTEEILVPKISQDEGSKENET